MKQYRIGAIAKLTGLSVHNLRVWEKRHNAIETERTDSGRRVYSEAALRRLKLLKRCVDNGLAISTVASMSNDELEDTLHEFSFMDNQAPDKPALNVCLVGSEVLPSLQQSIQQHLNVGRFDTYATLQSLSAGYQGQLIDLLMLDIPSFSALQAKEMGALIKQISANTVVLLYRFARQQDVAYLRTLGVKVMKAPIDTEQLKSLLLSLSASDRSAVKPAPLRQAPPRQFSDNALNKAANITSSIDCECPHHMAEVIMSLIAFEQYSAQCESKDKAGEDLHHHIYLQTSQARSVMESLLRSVLDQEGIDLSLVEAGA